MTPEEIKAARERLGMTQRELALALGVTERSLVAWERDGRATGSQMLRLALERLAAARGIDIARRVM